VFFFILRHVLVSMVTHWEVCQEFVRSRKAAFGKLQGQASIFGTSMPCTGNTIVPTVVVAEGDRLLRSAVAAYLKNHGYSIIEAGDALSTLDHLRQATVDAVLLDTYLNWQDVDLLKYIRSQPEWACIPIVAIVAADYNIESLDCLRPGDYLRIPFDMPFLDWVLENLLAGLYFLNRSKDL
jgi:CheY-like chemotaxis protein